MITTMASYKSFASPNAPMPSSSSSSANQPMFLPSPPSLSPEGPDELERILSVLGISVPFENEQVAAYRPGGFRPVHFGDLFHHRVPS